MHVLNSYGVEEEEIQGPVKALCRENDNSLMRSLKEYISTEPEEQHFYDFRIICNNNNTEVKCHKIILACQTKYFEGLFRQQKCDHINLDFHSDSVKTCIRYLYTEDISISGDNVQDILIVANYLIIPKIVRICVRYILANMNVSNCIEVLNLGDQFNIPEITREASDAIAFSLGPVFKDENNLKKTPLHLFKSLLSHENITLKSCRKVTLSDSQKKIHLADIVKRYCTLTSQIGETKGLLNLINAFPETRNSIQTFESSIFGTYQDRPRLIRLFDLRGTEDELIQVVTLKTSSWDGRTVVSGIVLKWTDGKEDEAGAGDIAAVYEVPEGEHISLAYGFAGWYVDNLTFVLSNGKWLGENENMRTRL